VFLSIDTLHQTNLF